MRKHSEKEIIGIASDTLDFILKVSKSTHPLEFIGMLRADENLITDVFFLPGTISSDKNAIIQMDMMPLGLSYLGSIHSHPHPSSTKPSDQDLLMFSETGDYHIITCYPYEADDWKCYDSKGEERRLEVVEIELEEEEQEEELNGQRIGEELLW